MQDAAIPERVRQEDAKQRSQGASGEPEGFFCKGKVYVVASALKKSRIGIPTARGEVVGSTKPLSRGDLSGRWGLDREIYRYRLPLSSASDELSRWWAEWFRPGTGRTSSFCVPGSRMVIQTGACSP